MKPYYIKRKNTNLNTLYPRYYNYTTLARKCNIYFIGLQ